MWVYVSCESSGVLVTARGLPYQSKPTIEASDVNTTADGCKPSAVMSGKERSAPEQANEVAESDRASALPKSPGDAPLTSALSRGERPVRRHIHAVMGSRHAAHLPRRTRTTRSSPR
jgi:hypothetical protein